MGHDFFDNRLHHSSRTIEKYRKFVARMHNINNILLLSSYKGEYRK